MVTHQRPGLHPAERWAQHNHIIFDLSPQVFKDAFRLTLPQQASSFARTDTGVNNSPTLLKREANTDMDVFGDEVAVIGGLVDTSQSTSDSADQAGSELLVRLQVTRQASYATMPAMIFTPYTRAFMCLIVSGIFAAWYFGAHLRKPGSFGAFLMAFLSGASFMLFLSTMQIAEALKLFGERP